MFKTKSVPLESIKLTAPTRRKLEQVAALRGEPIEDTIAFALESLLPRRVLVEDDAPATDEHRDALSLQALWGLNDRLMKKVHRLAELREQDLVSTYQQTMFNFMRRVPASIAKRNVLRDIEFESISYEGGLARIELTNGRVFYGFPSRLKYINVYYAMKDLVPKDFTPETYATGGDAAVRYGQGGDYSFFPGPGGVVIEGGAYVGYKAVRFGEIVGPTGKVIAIEIGRENHDLLCRNIEANGMRDFIVPLHCGIWKERGEMTAEFEIYASHSLAPPEEHEFYSRRETVPTDTLDNIIDAHDVETVDFINLQLNGAEYEAVEGLQRRFDDVKILRIGAYYTRDGEHQVDAVCRLLRERGCRVLEVTSLGSVAAATPKHAAAFERQAQSDDELERNLALARTRRQRLP